MVSSSASSMASMAMGGMASSASSSSAMPMDMGSQCMSTNSSLYTFGPSTNTSWYAINLINSAASQQFSFSIDSHEFWVYSADGLYVVPQKVQVRFLIPAASCRPVSDFVRFAESTIRNRTALRNHDSTRQPFRTIHRAGFNSYSASLPGNCHSRLLTHFRRKL